MTKPTELGYGRVGQADHEVRLKHGNADRRLPRAAVHAVFLDRKELVLLGDDSNELAGEKSDRPAAKLADWRRTDRSVES